MQKSLRLKVENLSTQFIDDGQKKLVVDEVSFEIKKGETVALVGESGSGKSITSLSILGLLPEKVASITSGDAWFCKLNEEEINLFYLKEEEKRKLRGKEIAMIFQEPMTALNPLMRCGVQVLEALNNENPPVDDSQKKKVLDLFRKVRLPDPEKIYRAYPHQLSGGQKQRVMIAMALIGKPGMVLADEPTTALDVTVQKSILELLNELKHEFNLSILFISHDLGVVAEIADRILVMYKGRIVEQGPVYKVFETPMHPYTKGLLGCRPPLNQKLKRLPVIKDFMDLDPGGNLVERVQSIERVIRRMELTPRELENRLTKIYSENPILDVEDLEVKYPLKQNWLGKTITYFDAVKKVSFQLYRGEILGLVGESGCGKSTLGKTLVKLIDANKGQIRLHDCELGTLKGKELVQHRKKIQMIFQDPYASLNPRQTIGKSIQEVMEVHKLYSNSKIRILKTYELLLEVGLEEDMFNRYPHEFSGGQRQRIGIARALAVQPEILICDESVSALDVSVQAQILNLLLQIRENRKLSMLFISHDLSVVQFIADRVLVMNAGEIIEEKPVSLLFNNAENPYTQKLLDAIPRIDPEVLRIRYQEYMEAQRKNISYN